MDNWFDFYVSELSFLTSLIKTLTNAPWISKYEEKLTMNGKWNTVQIQDDFSEMI